MKLKQFEFTFHMIILYMHYDLFSVDGNGFSSQIPNAQNSILKRTLLSIFFHKMHLYKIINNVCF